MRTSVIVRFQKEGIHCFPLAKDHPQLKDVSFLSNPHRHIFHIEVELEVFHDDREIEFILLKRDLEGHLSSVYDMNYKSCEMIAKDLSQYLRDTYGSNRYCRVDVFEDGENGARIIYE